MKLEFNLERKSRANKVFVYIQYSGGDADVEIDETYEVANTTFDPNKEFIYTKELLDDVDFFDRLERYLEDHGCDDYCFDEDIDKEHQDEYGKDVVEFVHDFGGVPGDPTVDYQFSCRIGCIRIIAYDAESNKYESYIRR